MSFVTTSWAARVQDVSATIDDEFGDWSQLLPTRKKPSYKPQPQPERVVTSRAIFSDRFKMIFNVNSGQAMHSQEPFFDSREPVFSFSRKSLPWAIERGGQIQRENGDLHEVKSVQRDGFSRIAYPVLQLGLSYR